MLTPFWLRLLGARVGPRAEVSTVVPVPSLMEVGTGAFLADDALVAPRRLFNGWVHMGPVRVGRRAFVGNSGIVAPGRTVPDGALIGVLSAAPASAQPGSSWLGQPAMELPRKPAVTDCSRTYAPPRRLVIGRALVECCRVLPMILSVMLGLLVLEVVGWVYISVGVPQAILVSGPVLLVAGLVATAVSVAAKWALVGRYDVAEHPLWTSFVWRNELADTFTEQFAVPWLVGMSIGTPLYLSGCEPWGARVGRGVWCETHWLPEPDLVELGDGVSINRGSIIQTHLFHDRLMRLDRVRLEESSTLGPHSIVLPEPPSGLARARPPHPWCCVGSRFRKTAAGLATPSRPGLVPSDSCQGPGRAPLQPIPAREPR